MEEATKRVTDYVQHYNKSRLHSAIGYVTPTDKLAGRADAIQVARDERLSLARERQKEKRAQKIAA